MTFNLECRLEDLQPEELEFYLTCYTKLPELVLENLNIAENNLCENAHKIFLFRQQQFIGQAGWLAYFKNQKAEPPQRWENELGIKAYAEQDNAWLTLIQTARLFPLALWMREFGSPLHLWFCTLFEKEYQVLQKLGVIGDSPLPSLSKRQWVLDSVEQFRAIQGESEILSVKLSDDIAQDFATLSDAVIVTLINIAGRDLRFREHYFRPYRRLLERTIWQIRDDSNIKAIVASPKHSKGFAPSTKRGRKLGSRNYKDL